MNFEEFSKRVGLRLLRARNCLGVSQEELAHGISTARLIGDIERGTGNPTLATLHTLCGKLNVTFEEVLDVVPAKEDRVPLDDREVRPVPRGRRPRKRTWS